LPESVRRQFAAIDSSSERDPPAGRRLKMLGTLSGWSAGGLSSVMPWVEPDVIAM